jgi:hypothetical protein
MRRILLPPAQYRRHSGARSYSYLTSVRSSLDRGYVDCYL